LLIKNRIIKEGRVIFNSALFILVASEKVSFFYNAKSVPEFFRFSKVSSLEKANEDGR
jgi:hypothetical protein